MLSKNEVIYEEPDRQEPYKLTKDEYTELKECPTYVNPGKQADIKLEDCPAYMERKKDTLEDCLAYGESRGDFNDSLDACPAYEQIANKQIAT